MDPVFVCECGHKTTWKGTETWEIDPPIEINCPGCGGIARREDPGRAALHESATHHPDCGCKYCLFGAEALPASEY